MKEIVHKDNKPQAVLIEKNYLYMIEEVGCDGFVKVGFSKSPEKRLLALSTSNPRELKLIDKTLIAYKSIETVVHRVIRPYHIKNEWFRKEAIPIIRDLFEIISLSTNSNHEVRISHSPEVECIPIEDLGGVSIFPEGYYLMKLKKVHYQNWLTCSCCKTMYMFFEIIGGEYDGQTFWDHYSSPACKRDRVHGEFLLECIAEELFGVGEYDNVSDLYDQELYVELSTMNLDYNEESVRKSVISLFESKEKKEKLS